MEDSVHNEIKLKNEWQDEARDQTLETLPAFLKKLGDFDHEYGTIPRAMAAGAIGAAWAISRAPGAGGGITGFQAGCVMWDFIDGWGSAERGPRRLVSYDNMLYPQYVGKFEKTISKNVWEYLTKQAEVNLLERVNASHEVKDHWKSIVEGNVPFGYKVSED